MSQRRFVSPLSEEARRPLESLHRSGRRHRVRRRAPAVLLGAQAYTLDEAAQAHSRRWNVCGFLRGDGELAHLGRASRLGAAEFVEAVETRLLPGRRRPSVLVLDNEPCHRARLVRAKRADWRKRGLRLFFLPPCCPHLNRIETLWRLVKHHRLPVTAYANFTALRENVTAILNTVGLDYRVSFV